MESMEKRSENMVRLFHTLWKRISLPLVIFLACLVILCVPVVTMIISYGISLNHLREQVVRTQSLTLARTRDLTDAVFQEVFNQMFSLSETSEVTAMTACNKQATADRARALSVCQKKFTAIQQLLPMTGTLNAYFEGSDLIVNAAGVVKHEAFEWYAGSHYLSPETLEDILHARDYRGTLIAGRGGAHCTIVLYQRIYDMMLKASGTLFVLLPYEKIIDYTQDRMIDTSGMKLYLKDDVGFLSDQTPDAERSWMSDSLVSQICPLSYAFYIEKSVAFALLRTQQATQLALLMVALLFGFALIFIIVYYARKHAHSLMRILAPERGDGLEMAEIVESIQHLNSEREEMRLLRSKDEKKAQAQLMLAALRDQTVTDEWLNLLTCSPLSSSDPYAVLVVSFSAKQNIEAELMTYVRSLRGVGICQDEECVALLPSALATETNALEMTSFLQSLSTDRVRGALSLDACLLSGLGHAYAQATALLRYVDFWNEPEKGLWRFSCEPSSETVVCMNVASGDSGKIVHAIRVGDYKTAYAHAQSAMQGMATHTVETLDVDLCLFKGMMALIIQALTQYVPKQEREALCLNEKAKALMGAERFADMQQQLDALFRELLAYQRSQREDLPPYIDQVYQEIENTYTNKNISIAMLAEKCGYNASYLSHYFKKYTGQGILDCLHQRRIARAQELLKTGMSVQNVADQTGYVDSRSLIRAFKRYVGITPGQYGKENQ